MSTPLYLLIYFNLNQKIKTKEVMSNKKSLSQDYNFIQL